MDEPPLPGSATGASAIQPAETARPDGRAGIDAPDGAGVAGTLITLQLSGVRAAGIARLLALRLACYGRDPALDGYVPDARVSFIRWLYRRGRIGG